MATGLENDKNLLAPGNPEAGSGLVEILVAVLLIALISTATMTNLMAGLRVAKLTEVNHAASSLAISKLEELASVNALDLDTSYNATESSLSWSGMGPGITFMRQVTVTINADDSRTVDVTVSSNNSALSTTVAYSTTFALWE